MVSITRSQSPLDPSLDLSLGLDEEKALLAGLRVTAGFLLSALFAISLVLSVHAFESSAEASPGLATIWGVNGSFLSTEP